MLFKEKNNGKTAVKIKCENSGWGIFASSGVVKP